MKKKMFTLITALSIGFTCFAKDGQDRQLSIQERDQKIHEVTQKDLSSFLESIPPGFEKQHGFNNRSEFAKATAGPVYTIVGLDQKGTITATNMCNVPVIVDGEYRAMITVSFANGAYEIETVGAALLATELQQLEKEKKPAPDREKIMLNVYSKSSGFIGYKEMSVNMDQINFTPLSSAKIALGDPVRILKPDYKLAEIIQTLIVKE